MAASLFRDADWAQMAALFLQASARKLRMHEKMKKIDKKHLPVDKYKMIEKFMLEGNSGGHLAQLRIQTRTNFKTRSHRKVSVSKCSPNYTYIKVFSLSVDVFCFFFQKRFIHILAQHPARGQHFPPSMDQLYSMLPFISELLSLSVAPC